MAVEPITEYVITSHAAFEMQRRRISRETLHDVLIGPEQRRSVRPGRVVLQSRVVRGADRTLHLIRVVVDINRTPAEVVTVYSTSKIAKYWSASDEG